MFDGNQDGLTQNTMTRGVLTDEPADATIRAIRTVLGASWAMEIVTDLLGESCVVAIRDGLDYAILVNIGLDEQTVRFMGPDEQLTFFGRSFHVSGLTTLVERCKAMIEAHTGAD